VLTQHLVTSRTTHSVLG